MISKNELYAVTTNIVLETGTRLQEMQPPPPTAQTIPTSSPRTKTTAYLLQHPRPGFFPAAIPSLNAHLSGAHAALTEILLEGHRLARMQHLPTRRLGPIPVLPDLGNVNEHVLAAMIRGNETEPSLGVVKLHEAGCVVGGGHSLYGRKLR